MHISSVTSRKSLQRILGSSRSYLGAYNVTGRFLSNGPKFAVKAKRSDLTVLSASAVVALAVFQYKEYSRTKLELSAEETTTTLLNWSGTHVVQVDNNRYWEPETVQEVEDIVRSCHKRGQPVRPIGSALSPNGIAFHQNGMMSMANLDRILQVDEKNQRVTAQAGARVSQVVDALRPYHLTLPNLASIAEQQMGGFIQVGAHGTGRSIAPVDHYVTEIKLVTPAKGTITLTKDDGELFELAKVGLGCLGVVVEVTMECVPAHRLVEHTFVLTREEAVTRLQELLTEHKHMRYMWIPYTDSVVVVTNDPEDQVKEIPKLKKISEDERFAPLRDLMLELSNEWPEPYTKESLQSIGFGELRDALLAIDPLGIKHVKRCNEAEAEFWKRSEGYQVRPSDELLQFDCGGQQWVWEVCFPTGTQEKSSGNDMDFMTELLAGIEREEIPAHSPIEQRWSASSSSLMSPAYGPKDGLHSWVGIINYLPSEDEGQRRDISELFTGRYCNLMRNVGQAVSATSHWAKLERPKSMWQLVDTQLFLQTRFPLRLFNEARDIYDPKNILGNDLLNLVLGKPGTK